MTVPGLKTARLLLRDWQEADLEPFAALNADPVAMQYFQAPLSRAESDALVARIRGGFATNGFGLWALEVAATGAFIGFTGLAVPRFTAAFTPCVEAGWQLARQAWGQGYATEAAREALRFGLQKLALAEIVSFTSELNQPSIRVMQRLGMTRRPEEDFDHPALPPGHRLRRHVLYRIRRGA